LSAEVLAGVSVLVLAGPQDELDSSEVSVLYGVAISYMHRSNHHHSCHLQVSALQDYVNTGGSVLLLSAEKPSASINSFLSNYGVGLNSDSVVRSVYKKDYFHPKVQHNNHSLSLSFTLCTQLT
jgi:hypothetical protein